MARPNKYVAPDGTPIILERAPLMVTPETRDMAGAIAEVTSTREKTLTETEIHREAVELGMQVLLKRLAPKTRELVQKTAERIRTEVEETGTRDPNKRKRGVRIKKKLATRIELVTYGLRNRRVTCNSSRELFKRARQQRVHLRLVPSVDVAGGSP